METDEEDSLDQRSDTQVNGNQKQDSNMIEEENKKMYTALLQNQVLGIDNPYLLHEIHNIDENCMNDNLYSQMQRQSHNEESNASPFAKKNVPYTAKH